MQNKKKNWQRAQTSYLLKQMLQFSRICTDERKVTKQ